MVKHRFTFKFSPECFKVWNECIKPPTINTGEITHNYDAGKIPLIFSNAKKNEISSDSWPALLSRHSANKWPIKTRAMLNMLKLPGQPEAQRHAYASGHE